MQPAPLLSEPALAPVPLLPEPSRSAGLLALAPAVRRVAALPGPPDLLGAHQVGTAYNWVLDQRLHQAEGAPPRPPDVRLCELCGIERKWKSTKLYQWGRIARYLEEPWVREASGRVSPEAAEVIVRPLQPHGRTVAAPWIRRLLLERAAESELPAAALRRAHDALGALERSGGPAPTGAEVRARIDAVLGKDGAAPIADHAPRGTAQGALAALGARLQAAGHELSLLPPLLVQADPADPALRQGAELLLLYARDLHLRLGEMLSRFLDGGTDYRRLPRGPALRADGAAFRADGAAFRADSAAFRADGAAFRADEVPEGADGLDSTQDDHEFAADAPNEALGTDAFRAVESPKRADESPKCPDESLERPDESLERPDPDFFRADEAARQADASRRRGAPAGAAAADAVPAAVSNPAAGTASLSTASSAPPAQVPAPPPARRAPFVHHLAVPYPGDDPDPSPAERHACAIIAAVACLVRCSEDAIARARAGERVDDRLALRTCRAAQALACEIGEVRPDLADGAEAGAARWEAERAAAPDLPREALFPVPTEEGAAFVPMAYLPYEVLDPVGAAAPSPAEQALWRALGLIDRARGELHDFHSRLLDHHDPCCDLLIFQLREALRDASFNGNRLVNAFQAGAQAARAAEPDEAAARAAAEAARLRAEASLVVLGAARVPEQHATIGVLGDGRPAALATGRGLSLVALGGTGRGKSHLGVLLIESMLLPLPGLSRLCRRGVPVVFAADWRKGFARHQHLCALDPNPRPEHWQWLRQHLHAELAAHLCCVPRVIALCLPGRRAAYEAAYPDLLERGLEVREVRLHPEDWGSFGYGAMLGGLLGDKGARRPQWAGCLEQTVGALGERAEPLRLWRELERAGLGRGRAAVRGVLERMAGLTSSGERIGDLLAEEALCVFLLEDEFLGPEVILPLEAAIMNALTRAAPPDLPLLFVIEEVGKQGMNEAVQGFIEQMVREARHGLSSIFLGAHLSSDLTAATVTLATGVAQLGGTSEKDVRRLAELRPELAGVPARSLVEQPRGVATLGFAECTDPALAGRAQQVILRPSCVHAGGETREVTAEPG